MLDVARYDVFNLGEALLEGDAAYLARMLDGLRGEGVAPPLVLWALTEEIRAIGRVLAAAAAGGSPPQLWRDARVWGASHQALMQRNMRRFTREQVESAIAHAAKGGPHGQGARARRCVGRAAPARAAVRERSARQARGAPQRRPCPGEGRRTSSRGCFSSLNCPLPGEDEAGWQLLESRHGRPDLHARRRPAGASGFARDRAGRYGHQEPGAGRHRARDRARRATPDRGECARPRGRAQAEARVGDDRSPHADPEGHRGDGRRPAADRGAARPGRRGDRR